MNLGDVGGEARVHRAEVALADAVARIVGLPTPLAAAFGGPQQHADSLRERFLAARTAPVELLTPQGTKSHVPPSEATAALATSNLYLRDVEVDFPALREVFAPLAAELGFGPDAVFVEAFIGRAGQLSQAHYDHDINFQILLQGRKEWRLQPNRFIENPLRAFHPHGLLRFREEAYSKNRATPAPDESAWTKYEVAAGDVVYVPRGTWHEVLSLTDTFAINLVLKGRTYASALASALEARLHRTPAFRAYLDGFALGDATPTDRSAEFATLKAAAVAAISEITLEEAALAALGRQELEWIGDPKELDLDEESGPPVRALAALKHPFTWEHALSVLEDLGAVGARNLVEDLVELGHLRVIGR